MERSEIAESELVGKRTELISWSLYLAISCTKLTPSLNPSKVACTEGTNVHMVPLYLKRVGH